MKMWMKRRKKTPSLNLDEEQEDDLVNWYKVNEICSTIKIKWKSMIRPRRTDGVGEGQRNAYIS